MHVGVMLAYWCHATPDTNVQDQCPGRDMAITKICCASLLSFMGFGNAVSNIVTYNHDVSSSGQWIIGILLFQ